MSILLSKLWDLHWFCVCCFCTCSVFFVSLAFSLAKSWKESISVWRLQLAQFPSVALLETVTEGMGSKTFPLKFLDNVSDDRLWGGWSSLTAWMTISICSHLSAFQCLLFLVFTPTPPHHGSVSGSSASLYFVHQHFGCLSLPYWRNPHTGVLIIPRQGLQHGGSCLI